MKSRLLIMENDQHVLNVLTFSLSREGYDIIRTTDGLDGLSLAEALSPSLIILDLQPPMDSAETCVCLREEGVSIPILVLAKEQSEKYYLECGADSCVIKPFPIKNLLTAIKDALLVAATIPVSELLGYKYPSFRAAAEDCSLLQPFFYSCLSRLTG